MVTSGIPVILAQPYLPGMVRRYLGHRVAGADIRRVDWRPGMGFDSDEAMLAELAGRECLLFAGMGRDGNTTARAGLFASLTRAGARILPAVFDAALLAEDVTLGHGTLVYPQAIIDGGVSIGYNTLIGPNAIIEAGCVIGNHCVIGANVILKAGTRVESSVLLADGCHVGEARSFPDRPFITIRRGVAVRDATRIRDDMASNVMIDASVGDTIRVFR